VHRRARVGMAGCSLHVAQRDAGVQTAVMHAWALSLEGSVGRRRVKCVRRCVCELEGAAALGDVVSTPYGQQKRSDPPPPIGEYRLRIEDLATELLRYFYIEDESRIQESRSLCSFCEHHDILTAIDVALLYSVVDMLRSERLLIAVDGAISLDGRYACVNFEERRAEYGEYEFRTTGFGRVVERMSSSVVAIEVEDADGVPSIGTGFFIGNQHTIITARHVVENMRMVRVLGPAGTSLKIGRVSVAADPGLDIASVLVASDGQPRTPLRRADARLLDEVLCVGYPPIPGFDAIQVAEPARVVALKSTTGHVVATARPYLEHATELLLMSARIKGGNSGGPVLSKAGYCVGVSVAVPISATDAEQLDDLGYGLALPSGTIPNVLAESDARDLPIECVDQCAVRTLT